MSPGSDDLFEALADSLDKAVAGLMAKRVVDLLEAIEVEHKNAEALTLPASGSAARQFGHRNWRGSAGLLGCRAAPDARHSRGRIRGARDLRHN